MAMTFGPSGGDDDQMMSTINTTPLVDIMLVLLIIFLITIPVVTHTVPVNLPQEVNQPTQTKPQNITIAIDRDGGVFWNEERVADKQALLARLKAAAVLTPQPEVHIRGDQDARYDHVGRVVTACQRAGITKLGFITEPPARGG
ncbi:Biopolymer transport protein ExbD/TolR [Candidatus Terasakiella magnetica]|nr:Biopolymer transport protein ExbD/TolR [Candidatus Terasakiella magnetica]